jgi:hypothetical protein
VAYGGGVVLCATSVIQDDVGILMNGIIEGTQFSLMSNQYCIVFSPLATTKKHEQANH